MRASGMSMYTSYRTSLLFVVVVVGSRTSRDGKARKLHRGGGRQVKELRATRSWFRSHPSFQLQGGM